MELPRLGVWARVDQKASVSRSMTSQCSGNTDSNRLGGSIQQLMPAGSFGFAWDVAGRIRPAKRLNVRDPSLQNTQLRISARGSDAAQTPQLARNDELPLHWLFSI